MKGFLTSITGKMIAIAVSAALIGSAITAVIFINLGYRSISVQSINGIIQIFNNGKGSYAYEGLQLKKGDNVEVGDESDITLAIDEDKYLYAESNTSFWVEATGKSGSTKTTIHINEGSETFRIDNPLAEGEYFEVITPNSSMSVRGTIFRVSCESDENNEITTVLEVFEGEVYTEPLMGGVNTEDSMIITSNQKVVIRSDNETAEFALNEYGEIVSQVDFSQMPKGVVDFLEQAIDSGRDIGISKEELNSLSGDTPCIFDLREGEVAATCYSEGYYYPKCSVCGKVSDELVTIPMTEHSIVEEEIPGDVEGEPAKKIKRCSVCGEIIVDEEPVDNVETVQEETASIPQSSPEEQPSASSSKKVTSSSTSSSSSKVNSSGSSSSAKSTSSSSKTNNSSSSTSKTNTSSSTSKASSSSSSSSSSSTVSYTITFLTEEGSTFAAQKVVGGKTANKPIFQPGLSGKWTLDGATYDFSSEVNKNLSLKWVSE